MSTDDVLSLIDGAIDDWTSGDSMRWRPPRDEDRDPAGTDPVRLGDVAREVFAGHIPPHLIDAPASEFWDWVHDVTITREIGPPYVHTMTVNGRTCDMANPMYPRSDHVACSRAEGNWNWTVEIDDATFPALDARFEPAPDPVAATVDSPFVASADSPFAVVFDSTRTARPVPDLVSAARTDRLLRILASGDPSTVTPADLELAAELWESLRPPFAALYDSLTEAFGKIGRAFAEMAPQVTELAAILTAEEPATYPAGDLAMPQVPTYRDRRPRHQSPYGPRRGHR